MRFFRVPGIAWIVAASCALAPASAAAQGYPVKPVRLISPFPPGGGTDAVARIIAQALTSQLGQQVVIDSRGGANGAIGTELAAKSPPDGYALVLGTSGTHAMIPHMQKVGYDPLKDFSPVGLIAVADYVLVVHPSLPVKNVRDLLALAKARAGQINYAAGGTGTPSHLAMELLNLLGKVKFVQVPYKGNGPASIGLITGECSVLIGSGPSVVPHFATGKVRPIATTGLKRSLMDLPAIAEVLPGYQVVQWYGVLAPADTPKDVVERLNREIVRAVATPKVAQALTGFSVQPATSTPEEFRAFVRADLDQWGKVIRAAGIKGEQN